MGTFVDRVVPANISVGSPWNEITETVDYTRAYADEMRNTLAYQIIALQDAVGQYIPGFGDIENNIKDIQHPGFPPKPDLSISMNDDWPSGDIPEPIIHDADADFSFVEPATPENIEAEFNYTPGVYSSCLSDELCTQVKDSLVNGGTGLSDIVYGLIIARNQEARRTVEDQARRRAQDAVGTRGFDLPGGMVAAVLMEVEKDVLAKDIDAVNSTTIKDFELADANERFIKELSLKLEELQRVDYDRTESRLFDIAKTSKDYIITIYEQNVKLYIAEWDGVTAKLEAAKSEVEAIMSVNDSQIKVFLGRADVLKTKVLAISSENESNVNVVQARASVYDTEVKAIATEFSSLAEEVRISMEEYKTDVSVVIEKEKINLQAFTSSSALAETTSEAIANIASQAVASALGAINTNMSYGYSGSNAVNTSSTTSLSNSLSETHSFKEE